MAEGVTKQKSLGSTLHLIPSSPQVPLGENGATNEGPMYVYNRDRSYRVYIPTTGTPFTNQTFKDSLIDSFQCYAKQGHYLTNPFLALDILKRLIRLEHLLTNQSLCIMCPLFRCELH